MKLREKIVSPNVLDKKRNDSHFVPFSTIKWQMKEMVIDLRGILLHDRSLHDEYLVLF